MHPDEQAFHAALDAAPGDHTARLVFADWLEERGDPRAAGCRALGVFGCRPDWYGAARPVYHWPASYTTDRSRGGPRPVLPPDWLAAVGDPDRYGRHGRYDSRRGAEDAAALAFARLPAERRAELLGQAAPA